MGGGGASLALRGDGAISSSGVGSPNGAVDPASPPPPTRVDYVLDTSRPLADTLADLCLNYFGMHPDVHVPGDFVLRVCETEERITEDKIRSLKVADLANLRLAMAPYRHARLIADRLRRLDDEAELKKTVFALQRYLKESDFAAEFLGCGGFEILQRVTLRVDRNAFAYTLNCICVLLNHSLPDSEGESTLAEPAWPQWMQLLPEFIDRKLPTAKIALANSTEMQPNVGRPVTLLSIWLLRKSKPAQREAFYRRLVSSQTTIRLLVSGVSSKSREIQLASLQLINAVLRCDPERRHSHMIRALDSAGMRKVAAWAMSSLREDEPLRRALIEYQAAIVLDYHRGKTTPIDLNILGHSAALDEIWSLAQVSPVGDEKWRRIGFLTEQPSVELRGFGVLDLANMHFFARKCQHEFHQMILDQLELQPEVRCPIMRAAMQVSQVLSDVWDVTSGQPSMARCQSLFLCFEDSFAICLRLFVDLWAAIVPMCRSTGLRRVGALLRSHLREVLASLGESEPKVLSKFRKAMLGTPFHLIREAHLASLASDDRLLENQSYIDARNRLMDMAYAFMREQRLRSMAAGAWFLLLGDEGRCAAGVRFCKLDREFSRLLWADFGSIQTSVPSDSALVNQEILRISSPSAAVSPAGLGPSAHATADKRQHMSSQLMFSVELDRPAPLDIAAATAPAAAAGSKRSSIAMPQQLTDLQARQDTKNMELIFRCKTVNQFGSWFDGLRMLVQRDMESLVSSETMYYVRELVQMHMALWRLAVEDVLPEADIARAAAEDEGSDGAPAWAAAVLGAAAAAKRIPPLPASFGFWHDPGCTDSVRPKPAA
ncbi:hypothetical protein HK105_204119 [Polyrhizophydium stewartii]|uniref:ELMO domain-containing protein n=1 Tax=Polyrhizophydium stewartii TaxID=2732419 RepID=A0ABR4NA11_9FUNG